MLGCKQSFSMLSCKLGDCAAFHSAVHTGVLRPSALVGSASDPPCLILPEFLLLQDGDSPLQLEPKREQLSGASNPVAFLARLLLGTLAGSYYFALPVYMWLKNLVWPRNMPGF